MDYLVKPVESIEGEIRVPGDKSITHRAIMLASIADGFDLENSVLRGSACAAIVVSRPGCAGAMPTMDELEAFLKTHSSKATKKES